MIFICRAYARCEDVFPPRFSVFDRRGSRPQAGFGPSRVAENDSPALLKRDAGPSARECLGRIPTAFDFPSASPGGIRRPLPNRKNASPGSNDRTPALVFRRPPGFRRRRADLRTHSFSPSRGTSVDSRPIRLRPNAPRPPPHDLSPEVIRPAASCRRTLSG